ncbi:MAG: Flp pilus assembly complex ATPase component TadA [Bacilli bacterium]|nr:Flp pilus assembly complex ATPase component TadA [Bacilli bacterium]
MDEKNVFSQMDFGPLSEFLEDDDVTDISYSNGGQVWLKTLSRGVFQVERPDINNPFMEKLAFQCANVMGRTFNMAHPFLDSESAELRMNFVHDSIATNGIACLIRKTPAKIRLNKDKLITEQYVTEQMHDFLIKCVWGHCNIMIAGETGSGKTELVKYLASNTKEDEKIISIEDTLELHLDKIFPHRDIVAMKTNNIASYTEALVACMRQNPIWILLAEVRSAEAVMAVRNSISSGHHIISTIHADKAASIPMRMYALLEGSQDIEQYLSSIHRYIQIGIYVKGYFSKALGRFQREIMEVCEFYVDQDNKPRSNELYSKTLDGRVTLHNPTKKLIDYLGIGNVYFDTDDIFGLGDADYKEDLSNLRDGSSDNYANKKTSSEALDKMLNENATEGNEGGEAKPADQAPAAPAAPAPQTTAPAPAATPATTQTVAQPAAPAPAAPAPAPVAPAPAPVVASAVTPAAQAPAPPAPQAPVVKPVTTTVAQPTQGTPVAQQTTAVPPAPQVVKPVVAAPQVQVQATAASAAPQQAGSATPATATDVL